ncbi:MAG: hypothetical protein CL868_20190 [Cytophagaceae bacterium]|nr:hypothetical protein [Cytophagaceae bacterium]
MRTKIFCSLVIAVLISACSVEKFIPEDEYLYEGADVTVTSDTVVEHKPELETELETVLRPEPNKKFLGMRPGLYFYYKNQRENPGFLNKFFYKKMGEEPVYLSNVEPYEVEKILRNRLENNGFFYSTLGSEIEVDSTKHTARVAYAAKVLDPYKVASYNLDIDSLQIKDPIRQNFGESLIKVGNRFDLTVMKGERTRIDTDLKSRGYYNFNPGFLIFEADSNRYDEKRVDLFLRLKKDVPEKSVIPYKISKVRVYPNYTLEQDTITGDSTRYGNKTYLQKEVFFRPDRLDAFIQLEEGQLYSPDISRNTSRRLGSIGAYKYVNIRYDEVDTQAEGDSLGHLEANIFLSPLNKRAVRTELQAVQKSNGFAGPNLAVTFANRNLFKGGETLNLTGKVGYEVQVGGGNNAGLSSLQLGLGADLIFPRVLFPIKINEDFFKYDIPKTKVSLSADYLNRSRLYTLLSGLASFGYTWRANKYVTHEYNPISVNYVNLANTTPEFQQILDDNPFLQNSFDQEFISGMTYSFTYNGMVDQDKTHQFFLNANLDTAGNTISLFSGATENDKKSFLGLQYAQYAKIDADFRYHFNMGGGNKLATRLFAGVGYPYGNSDVLPYTKQYFSGGPYSVRAFRIRSLGPGTYTPGNDDEGAYFDQTGNLRLEANIEYRFPLFPYVFGAVFADAGNVWNTSENESLPGGRFTSGFMNELGIGTGVGVRVDIQNFVIRFDLAAPMHDPSLPSGERWVNDFGNPIFNFAIGYPF